MHYTSWAASVLKCATCSVVALFYLLIAKLNHYEDLRCLKKHLEQFFFFFIYILSIGFLLIVPFCSACRRAGVDMGKERFKLFSTRHSFARVSKKAVLHLTDDEQPKVVLV